MKRTYLTMLLTAIACIVAAKAIETVCYTSFQFSPSDMDDIGLLICPYIAFGSFLMTLGIKGIQFKILGLLLLVAASVPSLPYHTYLLSIDYRPEDFSYVGGCISSTLYILIVEFVYGHSQSYYKEKSETLPSDDDRMYRCLHCGEWMSERDIFCKHCHTITHKIKEMLNARPNLPPTFYLPISRRQYWCCPHCSSFYAHSRGSLSISGICTPIRYCRHCQQYFLDEYKKDWCVIPKQSKIRTIFLYPFGTLFSILMTGFAFKWTPWYFPIMFLAAFFLGCLISYGILSPNIIEQSNQRLRCNPDYPEILIKMGYISQMDEKYYPLANYAPKTKVEQIKDWIKEAFTFE